MKQKKIPHELLEYIFTFLDQHSAQEAAQVEKLWNVGVVTGIKSEQSRLVENLFKTIINNLDETKYPKEHAELTSLKTNTVFDSINLLKLKESLTSTREAVVSQLKKLDPEDLKKIEEALQSSKSPSPIYFECVTQLASFDRLLEGKIKTTKDMNSITDLAKFLQNKGQLDNDRLKKLYLRLAKSNWNVNELTKYFTTDYINKGKYKQALQVLNTEGNTMFFMNKLIANYELDKAIYLTKEMKNPIEKESYYKDIAGHQIGRGISKEGWIKTINTIWEDDKGRCKGIHILTNVLIDKKCFNEADELVKTYPFSIDKNEDLKIKSEILERIKSVNQ